MTEATTPTFWQRQSGLSKFALLMVGAVVLLVITAKLGFFEETAGTRQVSSFSRDECLNRQFSQKYGATGMGWSDLSESAMGEIARICAKEESEAIYGS